MKRHPITIDPTTRPELSGLNTANCHPTTMMFDHGFYPRQPWHDLMQYVLLGVISKKLRIKTPWSYVYQVKNKIQDYLREVNEGNEEQLAKDLNGFDKVWKDLKPACRKNLGMTKLMLDGDYRSRFLPKGITVGAHAILLEIFHSGKTISVSGEFEPIPYQDKMILMTIWEPIRLCMYERVIYTQQAILRKMAELRKKDPEATLKIVIFGAGLLPEFRTNDFQIEGLKIKVTAIDMEKDNLEYLKLVYSQDIKTLGINYKCVDMRDFCDNPKNARQYHLGIAMGVLSYYKKNMQSMVERLMRTLKANGELICDLQLVCAGLAKNAYGQGWESNLSPELTAGIATKKMRRIAEKLDLELSVKESDYKQYTGVAGINFTLKKTESDSGHRQQHKPA